MKNINFNQDFSKFTAEELAKSQTDTTQPNPIIPADVKKAFGKHILEFCRFMGIKVLEILEDEVLQLAKDFLNTLLKHKEIEINEKLTTTLKSNSDEEE